MNCIKIKHNSSLPHEAFRVVLGLFGGNLPDIAKACNEYFQETGDNIYFYFDITKHKPTRLLPKFWAKTEKNAKCLSPPQISG